VRGVDLPAGHANAGSSTRTAVTAYVYATTSASTVYAASADASVYTTTGARAICTSCAEGATCTASNDDYLYAIGSKAGYTGSAEATAKRGGVLYTTRESAADAPSTVGAPGEATTRDTQAAGAAEKRGGLLYAAAGPGSYVTGAKAT